MEFLDRPTVEEKVPLCGFDLGGGGLTFRDPGIGGTEPHKTARRGK